MESQPLYLRLANHYRRAIQNGVLAPDQRMPSVRTLVRTHHVSLSTALQACRLLEDDGLIEARPRSGYFVLKPRRNGIPPVAEPDIRQALAPPSTWASTTVSLTSSPNARPILSAPTSRWRRPCPRPTPWKS